MFMGVLRRVSHAKRTGHRLSRQYVQVKLIVRVCVFAPFVVLLAFRASASFLTNMNQIFFFLSPSLQKALKAF